MKTLVPPSLLVLLLCGVLAWQVLRSGDPDHLPEPPRAAVALPQGARALAWDPAPLSGIADTVLARPLFSETRKPAALPDGAAAGQPLDDAARLAGIIISPDRDVAIFATGAGKSHAARTGDTVGRETVRAIRPGQVTVVGAEGERVLHPSFIKPGDANPAISPAPRGRAQ